MSSSTPTPPLPIITTAPMTTAGSPTPPAPITSAPPAPVTSAPPTTSVFTPEEMTSTLRDLVTAVQGISLYLAGPHTTPPAAPPAYSHPATHWPIQNASGPSGTPLLPFQAGYTGGPPPLLHLPWYSVPAAIAGAHPSLQPPLAPAPSWPQWPAPVPAAPLAPPRHPSSPLAAPTGSN